MSIPQICPNCENHISGAHAPGCCYGTPEYAHIGWPSHEPQWPKLFSKATTATGTGGDGVALTCGAHPINPCPTIEELSKDGFIDSASAIRRLLAYLQDEPEEEPVVQPVSDLSRIVCRLADRAEELRKEAAGMYNIEARAKRNFAADVLDTLCEELA